MSGKRIALFVLILTVAGVAQVTVEEQVVTDSIDVFSSGQVASTKSPGFAMVQTLLIPGLGHQYLGKSNHAIFYFCADAALLFGAILCESSSRRIFENSQSFAYVYAGARGGAGADDFYWQNMAFYLDSDGYNNVQNLNRASEQDNVEYIEPHLQWQWVDESFMDEYAGLRERATNYHVAATFLAGAMVLNRIIAFIDIRTTTRHKGIAPVSGVRVTPLISPDFTTAGLRVSRHF